MAHPDPVLIAGGGIAGLATALALAKRSIPSRILEQRPQPSEAGAGIQIGPNGVRALTALGVAPRLAPRAGRPTEIVIHQGASGRILARMPLGDWIEERHGAPYWVVHRRDLQAALLAAVAAEPLIEFMTGVTISTATAHGDHVDVRSATGDTLRGAVLIGADGIRSVIRKVVAPQARLEFSGTAASRTLLPASAAAALGDPNTVGVWLAPGAHVVHYPVEAGAKIAVVAIVPDDRMIDDWAAPNDWATLAPHLAAFSPTLTTVLAAAPEWRRWALFETKPLARLVEGRVALVGDAAHPILPFLAQGGVMALEDSVVLADCLATRPTDIPAALKNYETARRHRVNAIAAASRRNGRIFHLSGAAAMARNIALAAVPASRLMARYDWVYGWRPPA
jgi:salicylate hydroxylase